MYWAALLNRFDVLKLLLDRGIDVNKRYQMHDIIKAKGAVEAKKEISLILQHGYDVDMTDQVVQYHFFVFSLMYLK